MPRQEREESSTSAIAFTSEVEVGFYEIAGLLGPRARAMLARMAEAEAGAEEAREGAGESAEAGAEAGAEESAGESAGEARAGAEAGAEESAGESAGESAEAGAEAGARRESGGESVGESAGESTDGFARGRALVEWLRENGLSKTNAQATLTISLKIRDIGKRDEVIERLADILRRNGKSVHEDRVKDLADCYMSRKKWSAKRLRDLYEGKKLYRSLLALHAIELGYGTPSDSILTIYKKMAEVGDRRRRDSFVGISGTVMQEVNIKWWRAQQ